MDSCPICAGAGYYKEAVRYGHPNFGKLFRCSCRADVPTPKQLAWAAKLREELGALADKTFADFRTDRKLQPLAMGDKTISVERQARMLQDALRIVQSYATTLDGWIYLYGTKGAGKSHLGAAVANACSDRLLSVAYASVPRLLDWIKSGYKDRTADERLEQLMGADLLIMDDLGTEQSSGSNEAIMFNLLNERDRYVRATVITSNLKPDAHPERIADRIYGQTAKERIVWMPIYSYRRI